MIVPRRVRPLWWHKLAGRANSDHEYESTQASPESRSVSLLQDKEKHNFVILSTFSHDHDHEFSRSLG